MRKFDTEVQHLKYRVLREVARYAWEDTLLENLTGIPKIIVPGKVPTVRCCVYKERAIVGERVAIAIGGERKSSEVIEVIDIACDECPVGGYEVTDACRGYLAHRCQDVCPRDAISIDSQQKAYIDKSKCIDCGRCARICPFTAITNYKRPCEAACKVKAISMSETKAATIDKERCTSCGACVYQCPFGAIADKSYILDVIDLLKESRGNTAYSTYAVVAPSIAGQFTYAAPGQVIRGIEALGFSHVVEAALGADMVADAESRELVERGMLISSCCPAFVSYVKSEFPTLRGYISRTLSPMVATAQYVKEKDPTAKVVFIGPCTAKKQEYRFDEIMGYVDVAMTFEELQALFDSRDIDITCLDKAPLADASPFGRRFAASGGLSEAVEAALKERGENFSLEPVVCDGIEECRTALLKLSKGALDANFIEGMACVGGCIGGAGCLTHGEKNRAGIERYSKEAVKHTIAEALEDIKK